MIGDYFKDPEEKSGFKIARLADMKAAASKLGLTLGQAETELIRIGIVPYRYLGTVRMVGIEGALKLRLARAAIVGCGGVGGFLCELSARLGLGGITVADGDAFDESNLNRQLCSTEGNLGQNKAAAAATRIGAVNSGIDVSCCEEFLTEMNAADILKGASIVLDATDSLKTRFLLEKHCKSKTIPFVFGGIGSSVAQISTVPAGSELLGLIFDENRENNEAQGSPAPTVALCAGFIAAEMLKIICGAGRPLYGSILQADWLGNNFQILNIR